VKPQALMKQYNPPAAKLERVSGFATLSCLVDEDNKVQGCKVIAEHPSGYGFATAAMAMSPHFRVRAPLKSGKPQHDVPVGIPVVFINK